MTDDSNLWKDTLPLLACTGCGAALDFQDENSLGCLACRRVFSLQDGILHAMGGLEGNNRIAADFYNSPAWPRFRIWEYVVFICSGGIRRSRQQVLKLLPNLAGTKLLEVAIGDGSNLPWLPADCEVYGNDISVVQLQACRRRFPKRKLRLVLAEAEALPFRDQTFDHVLSFGAFNYFNDPLRSLREMARVVKPGGRVVVSDEYPSLPNRMIGGKIGLPQLDRWILSRFLHLGDDFAEMVDRHRQLKIEPIVDEVLADWQIRSLWWNCGYVFAGRPKMSDATSAVASADLSGSTNSSSGH